jgi:hypothetical protein
MMQVKMPTKAHIKMQVTVTTKDQTKAQIKV